MAVPVKNLSIAFFNSFLPLELDNKLFDQLIGLLGANRPVNIIFASISFVLKYIKEDLQRILKTVLEV